ncbi:ninjurin-B-like [Phlebotomus argentipes]|uniref:ninjurin-B-like n=1 Tax=Phlebotomus argentipes TaxID=94469 RepID=UPI002892B39D|nr:ninjurin-B-like [Phlebotomus argentipes]
MKAGEDIEMGDCVGRSAKGAPDAIDGRRKTGEYASKKSVAEGMMDIALLTANANQLRFLITFNTESRTFYVSLGLLVLSLVLQVAVGIALIFKRQMKIKGRKNQASHMNDYIVGGIFLVTVINVLAASFTITEKAN